VAARGGFDLSALSEAHYILGFPGALRPCHSFQRRAVMPPVTSCPSLLSWAGVCLAQAADPPAPPLFVQLLPMVAIGVAAYLLLFRPERERQRRQQALLTGLKKNDRVVTAGGICGTVAAVDRDAGRVTLKVDESANVKLTVTLASIAQVMPAGGDTVESPS
jgi:preprotein translocase subunit YajC